MEFDLMQIFFVDEIHSLLYIKIGASERRMTRVTADSAIEVSVVLWDNKYGPV